MKKMSTITLGLTIASTIFLSGCNNTDAAKPMVGQAIITEESLGLRKTDLYSENTTVAEQTNYSKSQAMSGYKIKRAFQDAPPMIPHDTEGMLPITINNNQCTSCHNPDMAESMGATPLPKSHFTDFRPVHKFDGKKFETTAKVLNNEVAIKSNGSELVGARFNCTQCHAPQSAGNLAVESTFEAVYSNKDGASKSSWVGTRLTSDLDTVGKDSKLTEANFKNEHSPAGYLDNAAH